MALYHPKSIHVVFRKILGIFLCFTALIGRMECAELVLPERGQGSISHIALLKTHELMSIPYHHVAGASTGNRIKEQESVRYLSRAMLDLCRNDEYAKKLEELNTGFDSYEHQTETSNEPDLLRLSQDLLYATRVNNFHEADSLKLHLQQMDADLLLTHLNSDALKKAFWINIYNAFIQDILSNSPEKYERRSDFFGKNQIQLAGHSFSFDFIEHGILRRSKNKISLGYFNKLFPGKLEKLLRVEKPDYRIHFALNCGAESCPPIAFYSANEIDVQLEMAEKAFIISRSRVDGENVYVSKIFSWFRADFGGKKGIKLLLLKHGVIHDAKSRIKFETYNWRLELKKYVD